MVVTKVWISRNFRATEAGLEIALLRNWLEEGIQKQSIFLMTELSTKVAYDPGNLGLV
jgi:hypothetical protein